MALVADSSRLRWPNRRPQVSKPRVTTFSEAVYDLVRGVPHGRITSYGRVAAMLGKPRAARGVGYALSHLPADTDVPWWRVVNRLGGISTSRVTGAAMAQRDLLEREGVEFDERGRASWGRFEWAAGDFEWESGEDAAGPDEAAAATRPSGERAWGPR